MIREWNSLEMKIEEKEEVLVFSLGNSQRIRKTACIPIYEHEQSVKKK